MGINNEYEIPDDFIKIVKKKKINFKNKKNENEKLENKNSKNKHYSFDELLDMINSDPIKNINNIFKHRNGNTKNVKVKLDKIVEEQELVDYYSQISHFVHSRSVTNTCVIYSWPFLLENKVTILSLYEPNFKYKQIIKHNTWYYKTDKNDNSNENVFCKITDINKFIKENTINLQNYLDNNILTNKAIEILKNVLGSDYYLTFYELGWVLYIGSKNDDYNELLRITIDRFNINNTKINFKNTENVYNYQQLLEFINKNQTQIELYKKQVSDYNLIKNNKIKEKREIDLIQSKIEKDLFNLKIEEKLQHYESTLKQKKKSNFFITRTKKEFIETISCKPFVIKEYWET